MRLTLPSLPSEKRPDKITPPGSTVLNFQSCMYCTVLYFVCVTAMSRVLSLDKYELPVFSVQVLVCIYVLFVLRTCVSTFFLYL
jgi:hypothetical protein